MSERDLAPAAPHVAVTRAERRVRVLLGGTVVADSARPLRLAERLHRPVWYLPPEDVDESLLEPSARRTTCPRKGEASYWHVRVGERLVEDAVWSYEQPLDPVAVIAGHRAFYGSKLDLVEGG